jgi:hypothetical protein
MGAKGIDPIGGAEDAALVGAAVRPRAARKRPPTKAELRAQAEAAFRQWNSREGDGESSRGAIPRHGRRCC